MDCSPPGSLVRGISQAWILEWVAISFSRGSSWPRDGTWVSRIVGRCFTVWTTREVHQNHRRVVVSFKRMSVEIFYRWNLLPRSQLSNYMHSWRQEAICWYEVIPTEAPSFTHSWIADRRCPCWRLAVRVAQHHVCIDYFQNMCGELIHILQGHDHKGYQAFLGMTAAPMDVRQWADRDDASGENTVVPPETYVKVAGHLRSFQNTKTF